ncbi:MAG: hypothetical protein IJ563_09340 [Selenomonadaceae bacterium]|nr:hypothetical protein [Selenomonadaceae bacterium]MBR1858568.1 hypothetical protein [Selenomonadaceae bacterium]
MENLINLSQFTSLAAVTSNAIAEIGSGTTIAMATDSDAGIMKLYTSTGANEDGTMTQFEITKLLRNITVSGGSSTMTKISKLPSQAEAVTYNGSAQQASWDDFDATELIIDGEIEASDAGVHTVGFTAP